MAIDERRIPPERDGYRYPLVQSDERELSEDYSDELYLCDIDNTYLITKYKSLRDFIRLALEPAQDKKPVPGAPALMQGIRHGAEGAEGVEPTMTALERRALYFVSASPESMRKVLERRLFLDEVEFDGASFRDLWAGKTPHLRHIRDIYGYKVAALLTYRLRHPKMAKEILFGDDLEFDAEVYVLYSRICEGRIRGDALDGVLEERGLLQKDRRYIVKIADELPEHDAVQRIFIRKVRKKTAEEQESSPFDSDDSRIHFFADYLQAGLLLYAYGHLHPSSLPTIAYQVDAAKKGPWLKDSFAGARESLAPDHAAKIDDALEAKIEQGILKLKIIASAKQEPEDKASADSDRSIKTETTDKEIKGEGCE